MQEYYGALMENTPDLLRKTLISLRKEGERLLDNAEGFADIYSAFRQLRQGITSEIRRDVKVLLSSISFHADCIERIDSASLTPSYRKILRSINHTATLVQTYVDSLHRFIALPDGNFDDDDENDDDYDDGEDPQPRPHSPLHSSGRVPPKVAV